MRWKNSLLCLLALSFTANAQLSEVGTEACYDDGGTTWISTDLTKPTGTASGDVIVIVVAWYENNDSVALDAITGFTERSNTVFDGTADTETRLSVYTRDADGGEGAAFTVGRDSPIFASACVVTFRGASTLTYASISAGTPGSAVTAIDAPSMSGADTQGLLAIYALNDPGTSHSQTEGMTLAAASPDNTTNGRVYYESLAATGATGVRELTWTTSRDALGVSMLLDGASAGGGGGASIPIISHNRRMRAR